LDAFADKWLRQAEDGALAFGEAQAAGLNVPRNEGRAD
jgi:hypothetical protein